MTPISKPHLRNALKKLRAISFDAVPIDAREAWDQAKAAQEMLDFLAMLAGLKPVYLAGRGFGPPSWLQGVQAIAEGLKLTTIEGPAWLGPEAFGGLAWWYAEATLREVHSAGALYICKTRAAAEGVRAACATAEPAIAEEARLLGYPECCVADHYLRVRAANAVWFGVLGRAGGGDEAEMRRLLAEGAPLVPTGEDAIAALEAAIAVIPCPYMSLNMCANCATAAASPAWTLSARYQKLCQDVDPGLFTEIAAPAVMPRL